MIVAAIVSSLHIPLLIAQLAQIIRKFSANKNWVTACEKAREKVLEKLLENALVQFTRIEHNKNALMPFWKCNQTACAERYSTYICV